ncbi:transposase [Phascolarctobacterium sp.]|uniref:transposase n=1 Tax=Phascolarctobacterium sp. TaxID=2049039 RepID=UPI00386C9A92
MAEVMEAVTITKLKRDLVKLGGTMDNQQARYYVDLYYQEQEMRKALVNQCREFEDKPELLTWFAQQHKMLEEEIKKVLTKYVNAQPVGKWMSSIPGIGPVIAAGLMAHIDISKVQTAGAIWRYAGLDPSAKWEKGQKRPWNAKLKTLCWKIGESFVKQSNRDADVYGHLYKERKAYEQEKNEAGEYKLQAEWKLEHFKIGKTTEAYKWYSQGMLPPAHINERAKRYAVKMFLSHLFEVWYTLHNQEKPPKPYAIDILGHAHEIRVPNWEE